MKYNKLLLFILSFSILLTGCNRQVKNDESQSGQKVTIETQSNNRGEKVQENAKAYGKFQIINNEGSDFNSIIDSNKLDMDYDKEFKELQDSDLYSTQASIELESKYTEYWDAELNSIYNKLLNKLSNSEKAKLIKSQKGWLAFHINETQFINEAWDDFGLGSQSSVEEVVSIKSRIRDRVIDLMEYYYLLGGDIEFVYKSKL